MGFVCEALNVINVDKCRYTSTHNINTVKVCKCGKGCVLLLVRWQRTEGAVVRRKDIPSTPEDGW